LAISTHDYLLGGGDEKREEREKKRDREREKGRGREEIGQLKQMF
jgi:hypothetical protein